MLFHDSLDANAETARLAARYGFATRNVYDTLVRGFTAEMSPSTLAALRCEPSVRSVDYNGVLGHANRQPPSTLTPPALEWGGVLRMPGFP